MTAATHAKHRAVEEVADELRRRVLTAVFPAGSNLPAERELCAELGVSRVTLRAALARLESEGLVEPRHGSGTRVLAYRERGTLDLVGHLARIALEGGDVPMALLADLLELRRSVAVEAVGLAAERASKAELFGLRAHLRLLGQLEADPARRMRADLQFARLVVQATHNLALELLYNTIGRLLEGTRGMEAFFLVDGARTLEVYGLILDQLDRRDAPAARETARIELDALDHGVLERVAMLAESARAGRKATTATSASREA